MIKVKTIEFWGDPVFNNKRFDFTIGGTAVSTVVIAGVNGCGKTHLLEVLCKRLNSNYFQDVHQRPEGEKGIEIVLDVSEEDIFMGDSGSNPVRANEIVLRHYPLHNGGFEDCMAIRTDRTESYHAQYADGSSIEYPFCPKSLYSSVNVNYFPQKEVKGPTNSVLDSDRSSSNTSHDIASDVIQLIVDISTQDALDLNAWVREHPGQVPSLESGRIKRFTDAFEQIFGSNLCFSSIRNNTVPIFKKSGKEVEIRALSSGEKQVVFRGVYLLRDKISLQGAIVAIDEPEISMHPMWEKKILDYYRHLFISNGIQTSQLFFATHSEHVLETALTQEDCVVVKIGEGVTEVFNKGCVGKILPSISIGEIKYLIYDVYTTDFHIALYARLQELAGGTNIFNTDAWILSTNSNVPRKAYVFDGRTYATLPTYIRNCIDHPSTTYSYTDEELRNSIDFMVQIVKNPPHHATR